MLRGEAANTNFLVFGMTPSGLEPLIYLTQAEHVDHYTTNLVTLGIHEMHLDKCKLIQTVKKGPTI